MELSNNLTELHTLIYAFLARIDVLEAENAMLRVQLGMNSKNSHKPPSTDVFVKKPALSGSKGKQKGG